MTGKLLILKKIPSSAKCYFRSFATTSPIHSRPLPPRSKINEEDITENFIKGGGKGGQKINKTNSLVQLIHHPTNISIRCQETRSRAQNRTIARRILAERIEELEKGDESRTVLKAEKAKKKKANMMKKKRRKYQNLGDSKEEQDEKTATQGEEMTLISEQRASSSSLEEGPNRAKSEQYADTTPGKDSAS
ncbi:MAG: hypothetical protein M1831_001861 [Alyxoria varia]|nr:MAG: hypothetical protein M1831_001861 [Alyxoria varia]